jgi:hypothetical protein
MEAEDVRHFLGRWREDRNLDLKVMAHVHDRHGKTRKLLGNPGPGKQARLDPNHVLRSFERKLIKVHIPSGIKEKLRQWFIFILHMKASTEEKTAHSGSTLFLRDQS